jgi:hypothetical protein
LATSICADRAKATVMSSSGWSLTLEARETHAPDDLAGRDRSCDHRLHHPRAHRDADLLDVAGVRTCQDAHGYVSHETEWQGRTNGWDNRGDTWSTSHWRDNETTTLTPPEP